MFSYHKSDSTGLQNVSNSYFRSASVLLVGCSEFICIDQQLLHEPSHRKPGTGMRGQMAIGKNLLVGEQSLK